MRIRIALYLWCLISMALWCLDTSLTPFVRSVAWAQEQPSDISSATSKQAVSGEKSQNANSKPVRQDWTSFLGPHGTGVSDETGLLNEWPAAGPAVLWEKRIGKGYSSPSVIGNRVVIHHRQRDRDLIECLNVEDGSAIWKHEYDTNFSDPYGYNNGPRCSPVLTKSRCYTFGAQGRLICLDLANGNLIWEHETAHKWKVPIIFLGQAVRRF